MATLREVAARAGVDVSTASKVLGGGTGKNADFVQGGGPNVAALPEAEALAREQARAAVGS